MTEITDETKALACKLCQAKAESINEGFCPRCYEVWEQLNNPGVNIELSPDAALKRPALTLHSVLARYTESCGVKFTLDGTEVRADQIFQPEVIMPVIAIEALRIWRDLAHTGSSEHKNFGIQFVPNDSDGFFPYAAYCSSIQNDISSTLRLLTCTLATRRVLALKENETIELKPFVTVWDTMDWHAQEIADIPIPEDFDAKFQHTEFKNHTGKHKNIETMAGGASVQDTGLYNPFASQVGLAQAPIENN